MALAQPHPSPNELRVLAPRGVVHLEEEDPIELLYPPRALLLVAGLPGAGKTHLLRRAVAPHLAVDSEALYDALAPLLRRWPGLRPALRPLLHLVHAGRALARLRGDGAVVVHQTATRPWVRRVLARAARAHDRPAHLLLLVVEEELAAEGRRRRGRGVGRRAVARHERRLGRWLAALQGPDGAARLAGDGYDSCVVAGRPAADGIKLVSFAASPA